VGNGGACRWPGRCTGLIRDDGPIRRHHQRGQPHLGISTLGTLQATGGRDGSTESSPPSEGVTKPSMTCSLRDWRSRGLVERRRDPVRWPRGAGGADGGGVPGNLGSPPAGRGRRAIRNALIDKASAWPRAEVLMMALPRPSHTWRGPSTEKPVLPESSGRPSRRNEMSGFHNRYLSRRRRSRPTAISWERQACRGRRVRPSGSTVRRRPGHGILLGLR